MSSFCGHVYCKECQGAGRTHSIPEPPIPSSSPITVIRERIEELRRQGAKYAEAMSARARVGDDHGARYCAMDMNLVDYEIKGLEFAMKAMGVTE